METKRSGPYVGTIVLTLAQPAILLYVLAAMQASAGCSGGDRTGICDTRNELLAWQVPFFACSAAVLVAWVLVTGRRTRWQAWGVAACWVVSLVALRYSWALVSDVP